MEALLILFGSLHWQPAVEQRPALSVPCAFGPRFQHVDVIQLHPLSWWLHPHVNVDLWNACKTVDVDGAWKKSKSFLWTKKKVLCRQTWVETWGNLESKRWQQTKANGCPAGAATSWPLNVTHRMLRSLFSTSCQDVKKELNPRKTNLNDSRILQKVFHHFVKIFRQDIADVFQEQEAPKFSKNSQTQIQQGLETCLNMVEEFWDGFATHMCMQGSHWG